MNANNTAINARQLAFFAAFLLPLGKLLELPSLLTSLSGGDLLIAALIGLMMESLSFLLLFLFCKRTGSTPFKYFENTCGSTASRIFQGLYALFLLLYATLPLFDLEKFSHAAFSDTSPTFFVFTPFFILSGFIITKGIKGMGRAADLSPILCLLPLLGLLGMSVGQADFSRLLPVMEKSPIVSFKAVWKTSAYFSSGGLLLPLMQGYKYEDGDEKKLFPAFAVGVFFTLLFLAVFFAVFGVLGGTEHFAVMKIAQFFPPLKFIGRIDLLLVYALSIGLFYYTSAPLLLCADCANHALDLKSKLPLAVFLSAGWYFCVLFGNKHLTEIHAFFSSWLAPVFLFFSVLLPLLFFLSTHFKPKRKHSQQPPIKSKKEKRYEK